MELLETILHSFANLAILLFEYIGVAVITFSGIQGFVNCLRRKPETRLILAKGLALGLEFKLGSEILRTVIVRNLNEIYIVGGIIVLRAVLTFLIHWEIKTEEKNRDTVGSAAAQKDTDPNESGEAPTNRDTANTPENISNSETGNAPENAGSSESGNSLKNAEYSESGSTPENTGTSETTDVQRNTGTSEAADVPEDTDSSAASVNTDSSDGTFPAADTATAADAISSDTSPAADATDTDIIAAAEKTVSVSEKTETDEVSKMEAALDAAVKAASEK